jgi:hypothetical protein
MSVTVAPKVFLVKTLWETVLERQFPQANNRTLANDDVAVDITNRQKDLEMNKEAEEQKLH